MRIYVTCRFIALKFKGLEGDLLREGEQVSSPGPILINWLARLVGFAEDYRLCGRVIGTTTLQN